MKKTTASWKKKHCQSCLLAPNSMIMYMEENSLYIMTTFLFKVYSIKNISKAPARIQRFMLRLQRYSFELHYIKDKDLIVADDLSRSSLNECVPEINEQDMKSYIHTVLTTDLISDKLMNKT